MVGATKISWGKMGKPAEEVSYERLLEEAKDEEEVEETRRAVVEEELVRGARSGKLVDRRWRKSARAGGESGWNC